jgi:hypothetical protein
MKSIFFWDMTPCSHIPEEDTLQNHRCEDLKSYIELICLWTSEYNVLPFNSKNSVGICSPLGDLKHSNIPIETAARNSIFLGSFA